MRTTRLRNFGCAALALLACAPAMAYDWLQFNGNPQHDGNNVQERSITRNNVGRLIRRYQASLGDISDNAPVFLEGVSTAGGIKDRLYVTTLGGSTFAIDAATGAIVWSASYPANAPRGMDGPPKRYSYSATFEILPE